MCSYLKNNSNLNILLLDKDIFPSEFVAKRTYINEDVNRSPTRNNSRKTIGKTFSETFNKESENIFNKGKFVIFLGILLCLFCIEHC